MPGSVGRQIHFCRLTSFEPRVLHTENQRVEGFVKMLEWLLDRGYPSATTGPIAREIN